MVNKKDSNTEERILAAARKVFMAEGMNGARMQDIADEAGINKALLHYYFRDKNKLFETIFLGEAQKFFPKITRIFESGEPLEQKIHEFVEAYITEIRQNPYLPWFVFNEINRDPDAFLKKVLTKGNRPNPARFLEQIGTEVRKGNIKPVDPRHLLLNLLSMTIFPFIARPMFARTIGISDKEFDLLMEQRIRLVPRFIMDSIRK